MRKDQRVFSLGSWRSIKLNNDKGKVGFRTLSQNQDNYSNNYNNRTVWSTTPRTDEWTLPYLVDKLKLHLVTVESSKSEINTDLLDTDNGIFNSYFCLISNRHYVNQAFHYLKIGALKPVPEFLISFSDLSYRIVKELATIEKADRKFVLKQAVSRIFEDINAELYHNSISKVLNVTLVN